MDEHRTFKNGHIRRVLQTRSLEIHGLQRRSHGQGVAEGIRHSTDNRNSRRHFLSPSRTGISHGALAISLEMKRRPLKRTTAESNTSTNSKKP
jgi:hypothetical protein